MSRKSRISFVVPSHHPTLTDDELRRQQKQFFGMFEDAPMPKYPEHEKLKLVAHDSQKIGEFIEWLGQNGYYICERREAEREEAARRLAPEPNSLGRSRLGEAFCAILQMIADSACIYWPTTKRLPNALLSQYFEIDENKIEDEKLAMLDEIRASHAKAEK